MSVAALLETLKEREVKLWFEGERLRFRAPRGALSSEQRAELSAHRRDIINVLRVEAASQHQTFHLSYNQRSLWFLNQLNPDSAAYNVAFSARIASTVDRSALHHALQAVVDRHAALRTTFFLRDGAPVQHVAGASSIAIGEHDVSGLDEKRLRHAIDSSYRRPFDLEKGPVFRASLFSLSQNDHILLIVAHHIAIDGWSLFQLVEELRSLYAEASTNSPAELAHPSAQYLDYVKWQQQLLAGPEGQRMASYWEGQLASPRAILKLPTDHSRPPHSYSPGRTLNFTLPHDLSTALRQLARAETTTLFVVLLAAFKVLLFRCTGIQDLVVGTPTFGRSHPQFTHVVGNFVNTIPLRSSLDSTMTFRELLEQLKATSLRALDAQEYPFPLMVERLHPEREGKRSSLFETFFVLQRFDQLPALEPILSAQQTDDLIDFGGLLLKSYPLDQQEGQFDLSLQIVDGLGSLHGNIKYNTDLFAEHTITSIGEFFRKLLEGIVGQPAQAISNLPPPDLVPHVKEVEGGAQPMPEPKTLDQPSARMPDPLASGCPAHQWARRTSDDAQETSPPSLAEVGEQTLQRLTGRDIICTVDGGRLRVNAPKGALDDDDKRDIAANREAIVAALTARLENAGMKRLEGSRGLALSFAQRRLWFLDRMDPGAPQYNIGGGLRLRGDLNPDMLRLAVEDLFARHEAFRTRIYEQAGTPSIEILEKTRAEVVITGPSAASGQDRDSAAGAVTNDVIRTRFSLAEGRLAAARIVRFAPDDHVLALAIHHIVADGWSLAIAIREIRELYEARAERRLPHLPELVLRHVDFAAWERALATSKQFEDQADYWRKALTGAPPLCGLPTDRSRPSTATFRGLRFRAYFERSLIQRLEEAARKHGATLFMGLLTVWQALLGRLSAQDDIVVGTTLANRNNPALDSVIGCFVNNVALRSDLSGRPSFRELLSQVKSSVISSFEHAALPFDALVEALKPDRTLAHAPIFQVLFTSMNFPVDSVAFGDAKIEPIVPDTGASRFDLVIELTEVPFGSRKGDTQIVYEYSVDVFDEATIQRLHKHFERLMVAACSDPGAPLANADIVSSDETRLLVDDWNATAHQYDTRRLAHQLLEETAASTPRAIAVSSGDADLTYTQLNERANQLAHVLRHRGAGPGTRVAVCLERGFDLPIVLAAALKAGAAYVPLDPALPAERMRYILEDAEVACLVTVSAFTSHLVPTTAQTLLLDRRAEEIAAAPTTSCLTATRPDDLAYLIYTSGSTGRPKGVAVEHQQLVAFLEAMRLEPGLAAGEALLAVTTPSFDIAGLEIWLPLMVGGRIVVTTRMEALDGGQLAHLLEAHDVRLMQATPATWRLLLEAGWHGKADLSAMCGGEAMPRDLVQPLLARVQALWNVYGPTETTIWSTIHRVEASDAAKTNVPIGRPIANTRTYVLEQTNTPAPIGVPGELVIAGAGVARGYRGLPELTAEKFVEIEWPSRSERAYRTGDLARWRADGTLEFLGRRDGQVKIRGYRIELGEIEARLAAIPGVMAAVVAVRDELGEHKRLIAYVVCAPNVPFNEAQTCDALRGTLPEYMIPGAFVRLNKIPLSANGKVDRSALPAPPKTTTPAQPLQSNSAMTEMERRVATIWSKILKNDRIGLYQNFFDCGGHSLLLVQLQASLNQEFGKEIGIVELFQRTTVAMQAEWLKGGQRSDSAVQRAFARVEKQING